MARDPSDPMARPHLSEANKGTRWKPGVVSNPDKPIPWSVRNHLRWALGQKIDLSTLEEDLRKMGSPRGKGKHTIAKLLAMRAIERALKKTEVNMLEWVTENAEGKQEQTINLPPPRMAPTENLTPEEAAAAYAEFIKL